MTVKIRKPRYLAAMIDFFARSRRITPESSEYHQWRDRFIYNRLQVGCILAAFYITVFGTIYFYQHFVAYEKIEQNLERLNVPELLSTLRYLLIGTYILMSGLLILTGILRKTRWGRKHPTYLLILFFGAISYSDFIVGSLVGLPIIPDLTIFMVMIIIFPVHWRFHIVCQSLELAHYFLVYPILRITEIAGYSIYDLSDISSLIFLTICGDIGVYLYERVKKSEISANHRLKVFIHSISHDLRTPVLGISMLLQSFLRRAENQKVNLAASDVELLLQGNERVLELMNYLLEGYQQDTSDFSINPHAIKLSSLVSSVLYHLQPNIYQNQIIITNKIDKNLPAVYADENQIWRVLCNLTSNALKYNPPQTSLVFDAEIIQVKNTKNSPDFSPTQMLRFSLQDNGVGISASQQQALFEIYARGENSHCIPGLGVGLYICQQIITKHGGSIGVISEPERGSLFWFTLPLAENNLKFTKLYPYH